MEAPAAVDILIVTVLPEEYAAVLRLLSNARPVQGRPDAPTLYGWRIGSIGRAQGGDYRVALALTGRAGTVSASQAVVRSVERWKPRYVLLVGIAGGLPPAGCSVGDAVVSTEIYGYEYGKIDTGFHPRPNWVYQVDRGLSTSAQAFAVATPDWFGGATPSPRVLFGPVASGDKVVDDPSEPFFAAVLQQWPKLHAVEMEGAGAAAAIEELRAVGVQVGFLMVRGISDMPRPPAQRAGQAAQTGERDANKLRACDVAASFAMRWIAAEWPAEPRGLARDTKPESVVTIEIENVLEMFSVRVKSTIVLRFLAAAKREGSRRLLAGGSAGDAATPGDEPRYLVSDAEVHALAVAAAKVKQLQDASSSCRDLPVAQISSLVLLLQQQLRLGVDLSAEQGLASLVLRDAPAEGWSREEILRALPQGCLDRGSLDEALNGLLGARTLDGDEADLVVVENGRWRAGAGLKTST